MMLLSSLPWNIFCTFWGGTIAKILLVASVTRLGDLLDFGQPFKATINLPKSPTFLGNFYKGVKIINFSSEINFGLLL